MADIRGARDREPTGYRVLDGTPEPLRSPHCSAPTAGFSLCVCLVEKSLYREACDSSVRCAALGMTPR